MCDLWEAQMQYWLEESETNGNVEIIKDRGFLRMIKRKLKLVKDN